MELRLALHIPDDQLQSIAAALAPALAPLIVAAMAEQPGDTEGKSLSSRKPGSPAKLLYSEREAASILGVSGHTLKKWRAEGYIEASSAKRPIVYSWDQILKVRKWIETRR